MGIFDLFSKKKDKQQEQRKGNLVELKRGPTGVEYHYTISSNFRGYKRTKLVTYGWQATQSGIAFLQAKYGTLDLKGKELCISQICTTDVSEVGHEEDLEHYAYVFTVEGNQIGTMFYRDDERSLYFYNAIREEKISNVYIKIEEVEDTFETYLFIKTNE